MTKAPPDWCPTPRKIPHRTETAAIAAALSLSRRCGYGIRVYDCCDRGPPLAPDTLGDTR